jgi:hypothetical protein
MRERELTLSSSLPVPPSHDVTIDRCAEAGWQPDFAAGNDHPKSNGGGSRNSDNWVKARTDRLPILRVRGLVAFARGDDDKCGEHSLLRLES